MSKYIVPAQVPKVSNDPLLQQQLEQMRTNDSVPEINIPEQPREVPQTSMASSGGIEDPFNYNTEPESQQEADMQSYYDKSQELFKDDNDDGMTVNDINPNAAAYNDPMGEGRQVNDAFGNPLPAEALALKRQEELNKQANIPKTLSQLVRMRQAKDVVDAYPGAVKETQASSTIAAARDFSLALINQKTTLPASQFGDSNTSLDLAADAMNTTTRGVGNLQALVLTLTSPSLTVKRPVRAEGEPDFDIDEGADAMNALQSIVASDGEGAIDLSSSSSQGAPREAMEAMSGRLLSNLSRNSKSAVDSNNRPIDPATIQGMKIPPKVAGAQHVQAGIDSGYYSAFDVDGTPHIMLTSKGMQHYMDSKVLNLMMTNTLSGRAQKVPVSETGELIGAQRNNRGTDIQGYGYQKLDAVAEVKRIYGSIGKISSPTKGYFGLQLFKVLLQQIENGGNPVQGIDAMKFFKIAPSELNTDVMLAKLNLAASEYYHQAGFMADGSPNFTRYKESYSTHRMYEDSVDFNEQRNKMTRAMMIFPSTGMQVNKTDLHKTGVSKEVATKHWESIAQKARSKNFNFTSKERELNFLAILGRALDVGKRSGVSKTENMAMPDMMSLVDSQFIRNAAAIGNQLASLVPNSRKEIVNEILAVVTKTDAKYNKGLKVEAGLYNGNPSAVSELFGKPLNEQQTNALAAWLKGSERETWGYTLQAYLDAAKYMDAKESGKLFTPRTTIAIDMNSAGRAFLAMDIGNENILSRVGLLWNEFSNREFQDVVSEGDPRAYFTQQARDIGVDAAFTDSEKQKTWKEALLKYGGPGAANARTFNSSFGKKVLLTTDYGKPMMFHLDEARTFLEDNPEFKQELMEKYNGDYKGLVNDLNTVYHKTLSGANNAWQYSLPKRVVEYLQMFGRVPKPRGVYGEQISIGKTGPKEDGDYYRVTSPKGGDRSIPTTKSEFDSRARAKDKRIRDEDGNLLEAPGPGTAARNQIGPVMGQYRESILMMETAKYLNQGKDSANMFNLSPVFDNYILDSDSYLLTLFVANNIVVPKVLEWDMVGNFVKDFAEQNAEIIKEIQTGPDTIVIGPDSRYQGILDIYDEQYKWLSNTPKKEMKDNQVKMFEFMESAASGYTPKESRAQTTIVSKKQLSLLSAKMLEYRGVARGMQKWMSASTESKPSALAQIKALARRNMIYFFT